MNCENSIRDDYSIKAEPLLAGFNVLVVDDDSTSLTIISKMLGAFGYKVVTAKRANEALHITREREDELHLILTEAHLPDMDKYELLEKMGETSNLPVVIMCGDEDENAMYGCLFKGAVFYLVKPLTLNNIRDLWQFAFVKKRETILAGEEMRNIQGALLQDAVSDEDVESGPFVNNKIKQSHQNGKRNWEEIYYNDEEEYDDLTASKKPKLVWTSELHNKFLQAVRVLGVDSAHPKKILQHMNVPGLKKENISSHLQKYRLSLKREQDIIQKTRIRESIVSRLASFHPSSTINVEGGYFQFPKLESITMKPKFTTHFQKNLSRQTSISSVGSAPFSNSGSSGCSDALNSKFGQSNLSCNSRVSSYSSINHAGTSIDSNTELAGFNEMGNTNKEVLEGNMGFRNMGNLSSGSTPNFQIFLANSFQQLQQQHFLPPPPALLPSPPQQQEEHDIFVTERGEIDELLDITKGSSGPIHDEDFGDLL